MVVQLTKRKFTVTEYHQMAEVGILTENDRVELIRGEIVEMSAIGRRHAACVRRLISLFSQRVGTRAILDVQDPVQLDKYSEPQPDITLLRQRADFYETAHPQPEDVILLVEVADTTVDFDREVKIPNYAAAGIAEVWLVDINDQSVEVYLEPLPGGYQNIREYQRGEVMILSALGGLSVSVDEILG